MRGEWEEVVTVERFFLLFRLASFSSLTLLFIDGDEKMVEKWGEWANIYSSSSSSE